MKQHNHSIYTLCLNCRTWNINFPGNKDCDCGKPETITYYPEECLDIPPKIEGKNSEAKYIFN